MDRGMVDDKVVDDVQTQITKAELTVQPNNVGVEVEPVDPERPYVLKTPEAGSKEVGPEVWRNAQSSQVSQSELSSTPRDSL